MEQLSSEVYHAQIYPLAAGYDLRVELTAVEFLEHYNGDWVVSKPAVPDGIPFEQYVSSANPYVQLSSREGHYIVHRPSTEKLDVFLTAQRFRDGRVYVCGIANGPDGHTTVDGLNEVYFTGNHESGSVTSFAGWLSSPSIITVTRGAERTNVPVYVVTMGDETAKLWAQQKLASELG